MHVPYPRTGRGGTSWERWTATDPPAEARSGAPCPPSGCVRGIRRYASHAVPLQGAAGGSGAESGVLYIVRAKLQTDAMQSLVPKP